jgi:hypothetical protein
MADHRRLAAGVLLAGIGLVVLGQLAATAPPAPLFDGLVVEEPYRFVEPPPGGVGDPLPVEVTEPVADGAVALLAVATSEVPPQAQVISQADAFAISADTTSITVSLQPTAPHDVQVAGNVYRLSITDQAGAAIAVRPAALITIVLRAPEAVVGAQVARFDGTQWVPLPTDHGGLPDLYAANIDQPGDFAVVLTGAASPSGPASSASTQASSPAPSAGSGGTPHQAATPIWVVILFGIAAVAVGLAWGVLGDADRR